MRVLSRCSNLPKAVACGYSEGAGFVVLTEPSLASAGRSAPHLRDPSTRRWRAVSPGPRGCAHSGCAYSARCRSGPHQQEAERAATWGRRPLLDGVGEVCKGAQRPCTRLWTTLSSARHVPPPAAAKGRRGDGVGAAATPPDTVDQATAAARWFQ